MKWVNVLLAAMVVLSLGLSAFSLALQWTGTEDQGQLTYTVEVFSDEEYRIYLLVNRQTVIADEFTEYMLYPVFVRAGDTIEIHGYSAVPFTVKLDDGHVPVATETASEIEISYTVPSE